MPLLPELETYLTTLPAFDPRISVEDRRAASGCRPPARLVQPGPALDVVRDVEIPVRGGCIAARVYRPEGPLPKPLHLFMHGGGFVEGSLEETDSDARFRAMQADCVVVSVDYRLAPENPYPTAVEDCYATLQWCVRNAGAIGADADVISVGGVSAGGNLAAAICLAARDRHGPAISFQLLEIPATDLVGTHESHRTFGRGYGLTLEEVRQTRSWYLGSPDRGLEPYASPLRAHDLSKLPPAFIVTGECDLIRDEGESYAMRLSQSGAEVTLKRWPGMTHGASGLTALLSDARAWRSRCNQVLRSACAGAGSQL